MALNTDMPSFIIMIGTMGVISIADDGGLDEIGEPASALRFGDRDEAFALAATLPTIDNSEARVVAIDIDPRMAEIQILALMIEYYRFLLDKDTELLEGYLKEHAIKSYLLRLVDNEGNTTQSVHPLQ